MVTAEESISDEAQGQDSCLYEDVYNTSPVDWRLRLPSERRILDFPLCYDSLFETL